MHVLSQLPTKVGQFYMLINKLVNSITHESHPFDYKDYVSKIHD
jgi:hypothetical protein